MKVYINYKGYTVVNQYCYQGFKREKNNRKFEIYYKNKFIKDFKTLYQAKKYINTRDFKIDLFYLS